MERARFPKKFSSYYYSFCFIEEDDSDKGENEKTERRSPVGLGIFFERGKNKETRQLQPADWEFYFSRFVSKAGIE